MGKSLVSVLMSFYNAEDFVREAVESVLNQTFHNFELILINDGSTDRSEENIKDLITDAKVRYIKNKQRIGKPKNLNYGISLASTEFIAIMDGDDVSDINRLKLQYQYLIKNSKVAMVGTFVKMIDSDGKVIDKISKPTTHEEIRKVCFYYSPFTHGTVMYKKSIVKKIGKYRNEYPFCQDIDLFLRIIYAGYETANLPLFLYKYRRHSTNTRHKKTPAIMSFRIKKRIKKDYKLKLTFLEFSSLYVHLALDLIFSGEQKRVIESKLKKIIFHSEANV